MKLINGGQRLDNKKKKARKGAGRPAMRQLMKGKALKARRHSLLLDKGGIVERKGKKKRNTRDWVRKPAG